MPDTASAKPDVIPSLAHRNAVVFLTTGLLVAVLIAAWKLHPASVAVPSFDGPLHLLFSGGTTAAFAGLKLAAAALIGILVTLVQRQTRLGRTLTRSMAQAQVLLCIAGALTMMVVGDSLPRAFAIAGAASIIRFRTPIDDPRDVTILFLLMGLGMATGLGAAAVALVGTIFVCVCLAILGYGTPVQRRALSVHVVAAGPEFPTELVTAAFENHGVSVEPIEVSRDSHNAAVRYRAVLAPSTSLDDISAQLLTARVKSVMWQAPKKDR